jgi:hypothetical protein
MSTLTTLRTKKTPAFRANSRRLSAPQGERVLHARAEDLLRDLAFVFHAVRSVRQTLGAGRDEATAQD